MRAPREPLGAIVTRCRGQDCDRAARCRRATDWAAASVPWTPVVEALCLTPQGLRRRMANSRPVKAADLRRCYLGMIR
jgi:hypothetical protein